MPKEPGDPIGGWVDIVARAAFLEPDTGVNAAEEDRVDDEEDSLVFFFEVIRIDKED